MFIMQVLASQLHFLANRNAGLAIPPLFWPVSCIKIGGHVAVHSLYCVSDVSHVVHASLNVDFIRCNFLSHSVSSTGNSVDTLNC